MLKALFRLKTSIIEPELTLRMDSQALNNTIELVYLGFGSTLQIFARESRALVISDANL